MTAWRRPARWRRCTSPPTATSGTASPSWRWKPPTAPSTRSASASCAPHSVRRNAAPGCSSCPLAARRRTPAPPVPSSGAWSSAAFPTRSAGTDRSTTPTPPLRRRLLRRTVGRPHRRRGRRPGPPLPAPGPRRRPELRQPLASGAGISRPGRRRPPVRPASRPEGVRQRRRHRRIPRPQALRIRIKEALPIHRQWETSSALHTYCTGAPCFGLSAEYPIKKIGRSLPTSWRKVLLFSVTLGRPTSWLKSDSISGNFLPPPATAKPR